MKLEVYGEKILEHIDNNILDDLKHNVKIGIFSILSMFAIFSIPNVSYSKGIEITKVEKEKCDKQMDVLKDSMGELAGDIESFFELEKKPTAFELIIGKKNKIVLKDNEAVHFATYYTALIEDTRFLKKKYTEDDVNICVKYFIQSLNKEKKEKISEDLTVSELARIIKKLLESGKLKIDLRVKK